MQQRHALMALVVGLLWSLVATESAQAAVLRSFDLEHASISGAVLTDNEQDYTLLRLNSGQYPDISTAVPADSGTHTLRAWLNHPAGYGRSEVVSAKDVPITGRHAYAFSIWVPAAHQPPRGAQWEMFSQMWQTACGSPPVAIDLQPNTDPLVYRVLIRNDQTGYSPLAAPRTIVKGALPREQWVQFAMEFNASPGNPSAAYFSLWVNGVKTTAALPAGEAIGYTHVEPECAYPNRSLLDLRVGIYRGGDTWNSSQVLHFDDMRFGDTISDVMR